MAIDRGTAKDTFIYALETCAILGALGGAGFGVLDSLGGQTVDLVIGAFKLGFVGFIGGSGVGIVLGLIVVILSSLFGRRR